jgi:hypothetical protein
MRIRFGVTVGIIASTIGCQSTVLDVGPNNQQPPTVQADENDAGSPASGLGAATPWVGNSEECPREPGQDLQACALTSGQGCAWYQHDERGQTVSTACSCYEVSPSTRKWSCRTGVGEPIQCADVTPTTGDGCFGYIGAFCFYPPSRACGCQPGGDATWACSNLDQTSGGPEGAPPVTGPAPVRDLTDGQARAWCTWAVGWQYPAGTLPPAEPVVQLNGFALTNGGSSYAPGLYAQSCLPRLTVSTCAANLAATACEAPIDELNDCMLSTARHVPSPNGCAELFAAAHCDDLFLQYRPQRSPDGGGPSSATECESVRVR